MTQDKRKIPNKSQEDVEVEFDPEMAARVERGEQTLHRDARAEDGRPIEGIGPSGSVGLAEAATLRDRERDDATERERTYTSDMASFGNTEAGDKGVPGGYAAADVPFEDSAMWPESEESTEKPGPEDVARAVPKDRP